MQASKASGGPTASYAIFNNKFNRKRATTRAKATLLCISAPPNNIHVFHDLVCFVSFERFRKAFCSGERSHLQLHLDMHLDLHMACI